MENKKVLLSSIILSTSVCLSGCGEESQQLINNIASSDKPLNLDSIELLDYKDIKIKDVDIDNLNINSIEGYHAIKYDNQTSSYFLDSNVKNNLYKKSNNHLNLKRILNKKTMIETDSGYYLENYDLKYNNRNDRNINVCNKEIIFSGYSYDEKEIALKLLLSLDSEIKDILINILKEEDLDEIIKFTKNLIYKSKDTDDEFINIEINDELRLIYSYTHYENINYTKASINLKIVK